MEDELKPFINSHKIVVKRQFIDNEPALERCYGSKVPVLTLQGETLCEYFLDTDKLLEVIDDTDK